MAIAGLLDHEWQSEVLNELNLNGNSPVLKRHLNDKEAKRNNDRKRKKTKEYIDVKYQGKLNKNKISAIPIVTTTPSLELPSENILAPDYIYGKDTMNLSEMGEFSPTNNTAKPKTKISRRDCRYCHGPSHIGTGKKCSMEIFSAQISKDKKVPIKKKFKKMDNLFKEFSNKYL